VALPAAPETSNASAPPAGRLASSQRARCHSPAPRRWGRLGALRPRRPAVEPPREVHLHFHGVTAEDVAAILGTGSCTFISTASPPRTLRPSSSGRCRSWGELLCRLPAMCRMIRG